MVGLIEKPAHITTQWFKGEGDSIVLLGAIIDVRDPLLGLGGSAFLQCVHGKKTGTPPRCDLAKEKALHDFLRDLIRAGLVKSAHDCSEGGLAVALAESCISQQIARETPRLIGATITLPALNESSNAARRLDALLFGETQARVVISVAPSKAGEVLRRAADKGVAAAEIGKVGGAELQIRTTQGTLSARVAELHDLWWNAIARAMND
jgi:phosphoribosylformylglycinamidine synthase